MLAALSTGHEIGLAGTGAAFIVFRSLSSFVFPRRDPNFPGQKGLRWYLPLAGLFFVAMMSSVVVFGREQAEAHKIRAEGRRCPRRRPPRRPRPAAASSHPARTRTATRRPESRSSRRTGAPAATR